MLCEIRQISIIKLKQTAKARFNRAKSHLHIVILYGHDMICLYV